MGSFTNPYPASRLTVDSTNSLVTGMQAWFPLTEGTGTSAQCILHPTHTGTLGSSVSWESSEIGTSVVSDGASLTGGINTGNPSSVQITGDLTIAAWVKCDSSTPSSNQYIVSKYGTGAGQRAYAIALLTSGSVRFTYQSSGNPYNSAEDVESSATLTAGTWHFVVGTFQASTAGKIYIDGELDTSNTSSVPSSIFNSSSDVYISGIDDGPSNCFDGNIQNVKIYNRALSATEVATLYHRPWEGSNYGDLWPYSPPASASMTLSSDTAATSIMADIEGWWVMTDGSGTTLKDISGNGRDATLYGTNTWETETLGTVNRFDNSSSNGNNARTADTQPDLSSGYTVAFWIKHEELVAGTNRYGGGLALTDGAGTGTWWHTISSDIEIYFNSFFANSQHPQVVHNRANGGTHSSYNRNDGTKANQNNVWHFWVVTFDGTNARAYQDASLVGTSGTLTAPLSTTGKHIVINGPADAATGLNCSMQNVRLYSRCLSADEVTLLYERPWEGIEYGDTFHYDPPAPASMLPLTSDAINTDQIGWWPLTETDDYASGAADISGNSYDLTKTGTVTSEFSALGTVPLFDGSTGYLRKAQDMSSHTSGVGTVSLWWRLDSTAANNPADLLFYVGDESTAYGMMVIAGRVGGSLASASISFFTYASGSPQNLLGVYDNGAAWAFDDTWHHFCYVVDSSSNHMYIDGVEISQSYYPGYGSSSTGNVFLYDATNFDAIRVGSRSSSSATSGYTQGNISNVRLWSRALTADEVWSIYATNPWLGSNYKLASGSTPLYNYIFRTERFRRLG